jgi:hypothetical protein
MSRIKSTICIITLNGENNCNVNPSIASSAQIQIFEQSNKTRESEQNGQVVIVVETEKP